MLSTVVSSCAIAFLGLQSPFAARSSSAANVLDPVPNSQKIAAARKILGGTLNGGLSESLTLSVRAPHATNKGYLEFLGVTNYRPNLGLFGEAAMAPIAIAGGGLAPVTKICGIGLSANVAHRGKPHLITYYFNCPKASRTINNKIYFKFCLCAPKAQRMCFALSQDPCSKMLCNQSFQSKTAYF